MGRHPSSYHLHTKSGYYNKLSNIRGEEERRRMNLLLLLLVGTISIDGSCAFTLSFPNQQSIVPQPISTTRYHSSREKYSHGCNTSCKMNLSDRESANDGDDDDGWGNNEVGSNSDSSIEKQSDRNRELTMLQEDIANKREGRKALDSATAKVHGEEKDLFIPIVTLVAVIGFAGLYGYEMLRLYARGELYLPWDR
jgi:hypothetical protein